MEQKVNITSDNMRVSEVKVREIGGTDKAVMVMLNQIVKELQELKAIIHKIKK